MHVLLTAKSESSIKVLLIVFSLQVPEKTLVELIRAGQILVESQRNMEKNTNDD